MQADLIAGVLRNVATKYRFNDRDFQNIYWGALGSTHTSHLLRQAGITQESWISQISCRLIVSLGHLFVALGHRVERLEIKPPHPRLGDRDLNKQNGFTITRP